eukprot:scaffold216132_cov12-Tisochrysis_lutea.AAC.1
MIFLNTRTPNHLGKIVLLGAVAGPNVDFVANTRLPNGGAVRRACKNRQFQASDDPLWKIGGPLLCLPHPLLLVHAFGAHGQAAAGCIL